MMGYYNTAFRMGHEAYCRRLVDCGAVGFILPDLPVEEGAELFALGDENELQAIQLMTPTNTDERLGEIGQHARGFVYVVARRGVTGSKTDVDQGLYGLIERCRRATDVPLAVGFGLSCGADLRQLQGKVEIGIVGSELLRVWEEEGEAAYAALLRDLAEGRN
jgi:tryptophan synthase alpha chain